MVRKLSSAYTGGAIGALVDSFNIWVLGKAGITSFIGVGLQPDFTASWLYPRLVWGGIWGLMFLLPVLQSRLFLRGILFSLGPSAMVLFMMFPSMGKGILGLGFGTLTPFLVVLLNFVWGMVASFWYQSGTESKG
ncbi:MAG: hypothetical protein C4567_06885 [Deltaproteobacteria bacterium]|nr:MAG: hypothetical protein C4567_06885 [Deltaproteobacteria bacterium]